MDTVIIGKNKPINQAFANMLENELNYSISFLAPNIPLTIDEKNKLAEARFILIDLTSSITNSRLFIREIHELFPVAGIIALHIYKEKKLIESFFNAGAMAYLLVNTSPSELISAIAHVKKGEKYLSSEIEID